MDRKRPIRTRPRKRFPLPRLNLLITAPAAAAANRLQRHSRRQWLFRNPASERACPPAGAISDPFIDRLYALRTWQPPSALAIDPVRYGEKADIPVNDAYARTLGPALEDAQRSLAVKLWLIAHARHTVDVMYYIFTRDRAGYAVIGALCEAVIRGMDVRIMVDSKGTVRAQSQLDPLFHPHPCQ